MDPSRSRMAARRALGTAVVLAIGLASASSIAEPSPPPAASAEAKAEERFRDGSQAFDAGRVEEACAAFGESLRLYPTLGTLLNLALCHEKQGKTASAWSEFTDAAAWASQQASPERRDFAHQHASRLEHSLSRVTIELASNPDDVAIDVDGVLIAAHGGLPLFLDPGSHVIGASAAQRKRHVAIVTVAPGGSSGALLIRIPQLEADAPSRPATAVPIATPARPRDARHTAGWIVGGAGLAFVVTGIYFGIDALVKAKDLASPCVGVCDPGPTTTSEELSLVAFGAGAAGILTGALLLRAPSPKGPLAAFHPYLVPVVTAASASLGLAGAW